LRPMQPMRPIWRRMTFALNAPRVLWAAAFSKL
jgi:hypothetical protein